MTPDYDALMRMIRRRRSVRRFRPDRISDDMVSALVEAARWAPTAGNRQLFRYLVVPDPAVLERMAAAVVDACCSTLAQVRGDMEHETSRYFESFVHFRTAPLVLAPIHREGFDLLAAASRDASVPHITEQAERDALASVSAATMNLLLAADALGLGSCWMTGPLLAAAALRSILGVPAGWQLAALIPIGYPDEAPAAPRRRPLVHLWKHAPQLATDEEESP